MSPFIAKAKADALRTFADTCDRAAKTWRELARQCHAEAAEADHKIDALVWCARGLRDEADRLIAGAVPPDD